MKEPITKGIAREDSEYLLNGPSRELSPMSDIYIRVTKKKLAEKVLSGKKLSRSDKQEIYYLLTGEQSPRTKIGRPSTKQRDMMLAVYYLTIRANKKRISHNIRKELAEKYKLPGLRDCRENTFYIALKRGIKTLRNFSTYWLYDIEHGVFGDKNNDENKKNASLNKGMLRLIDEYNRQTIRLKK